MTQPPDPNDPFRSSTRRFDPEQPTSSYPPSQYPTGHYETGQYGTEPSGEYGGGPAGNRRTKILIGSVVAGLLAILLVAFLISVTGGKNGDSPTATSPAPTATTTEEPTTSETTTSETSPTETTNPAAANQVSYRLVGDGDLIMVRYSTGSDSMTLATVRSPWSVTTTMYGGQAALNAIVVRGSVTCQIVIGGTVVSEGTSSGGPLSCSADAPE